MRKKQMKKIVLPLVAIVVFGLYIFAKSISHKNEEQKTEQQTKPEQTICSSNESKVSNTSKATTEDKTRHKKNLDQEQSAPTPLMAAKIEGEKILKREGYTCSYNSKTFQPNYVSWTLTPNKLTGTNKRSPQFYEDPELYDNEKAYLDDYYNSGYDRGHMCPAADNKWSKTAMIESFYLSNMCPQSHTLNANDWEHLETACRNWVNWQNMTIYITAGPIFEGTDHKKMNRKIPVPEKFFKTIVCTDKGKEKGIAFIYSNDRDYYKTHKESHKLDYYVCTIDQVENITGFDLYATLPQDLQTKIESQSDIRAWNINPTKSSMQESNKKPRKNKEKQNSKWQMMDRF